MMAFRPARGGYIAFADPDEREMLAGLARDVIYMLGSDVDHEINRRNEIAQTADPLAAFESELAGITDRVEAAEEGDGPDPHMPLDDALEKLLPDMSEDPLLANELRKLTEESVAGAKIENLVTFYQGLMVDADQIMVLNEHAPAWMGALNDIRLVLSARLGIHDDATANEVYQRAGLFTGTRSRDTSNLPPIEKPEDMMAVLYAMTSWWQESLVGAVRNKAARR